VEAALFVLLVLVVGLLAATFMWWLRSERQPRRAPPLGLLAALTAVDAAGLVASLVMANWLQAAVFGSQAVVFGSMLVQAVRARRSA
jgi:hypothetical protein